MTERDPFRVLRGVFWEVRIAILEEALEYAVELDSAANGTEDSEDPRLVQARSVILELREEQESGEVL